MAVPNIPIDPPPHINDLPPAPVRGEPFEQFTAKSNAFVAAQNPWGQQANALGDYMESTALAAEAYANYARDQAEDSNLAVIAAGAFSQEAQEWSEKRGAAVIDNEWSAAEHAVGDSVPSGSARQWASSEVFPQGSARQWAERLGEMVAGAGWSAAEHAAGTAVPAGSAKQWASAPFQQEVAEGEYSARHYSVVAEAYKDTAEVAAAAAQAAAGLPSLIGNARKVLSVKGSEDGVEWSRSTTMARSERSSGVTIGPEDVGQLVDIVSGTFVQDIENTSSLFEGWWIYIRNSGSGEITLKPNGAQTIDGLDSYIMYPGEMRMVQFDGTSLSTIVLVPFYATFISSGVFIKPPGYRFLEGFVWGGGSSGSSGIGGGGGGCTPFRMHSGDVLQEQPYLIAAEAVDSIGGNSVFSGVTGYGGGRSSGNGGGGALGPGRAQGGLPTQRADEGVVPDGGFGGGGGGATGGSAVFGGGGGGATGGSAVFGGGGGGATGGVSVFGGNGGGTGQDGEAPAGGGGKRLGSDPAPAGARGQIDIWGIV